MHIQIPGAPCTGRLSEHSVCECRRSDNGSTYASGLMKYGVNVWIFVNEGRFELIEFQDIKYTHEVTYLYKPKEGKERKEDYNISLHAYSYIQWVLRLL